MKAIIFLHFFLVTAGAQSIHFPDPALKFRLLAANKASVDASAPAIFNSCADANGDGNISQAEALLVYGLDLSALAGQQKIYSAIGLQYFTNLKVLRFNSNQLLDPGPIPASIQILEVRDNNLSGLPLWQFANLRKLDCSFNPLLSLVVDEMWNLQDLNVRNTLIAELDCRMSGIVRLDCGNNPNLSYVNIQNGMGWKNVKTATLGPIRLDQLPQLTQLCLDPEDVNWLAHSHIQMGQVSIFAGADCSVLRR